MSTDFHDWEKPRADRTLAERARELAAKEFPYGAWQPARELLTALADENDTLTASRFGMVEVDELRAERDRYWNLAEQLGEALEPAYPYGHRKKWEQNGDDMAAQVLTDYTERRKAALAAFREAREARDV